MEKWEDRISVYDKRGPKLWVAKCLGFKAIYQWLDLGFRPLSPGEVRIAVKTLSREPTRVQLLWLDGPGVKREDILLLAKIIPQCLVLEYIEITGHEMSKYDLQHILAAFVRNGKELCHPLRVVIESSDRMTMQEVDSLNKTCENITFSTEPKLSKLYNEAFSMKQAKPKSPSVCRDS